MAIKTEVIGLDEVRNLLKSMPEDFFDKARKEIGRTLFEAQSKIVLPMSIGRFNLQSRTGNLARSIKFNLNGKTLDTLTGSLHTDSVYAPIHEHGGLIIAKNAYMKLPGGPFLNIPSRENKTKSGVLRRTARTVFKEGGYIVPIDAPKARYMVALNGEPMFWLVKSVEIEGNLRMLKTTEAEVPTLLSNLNKILLKGL